MLMPEAMLSLAADLTGAAADGDAESLAAIAWRLYGEAGQNLAEIGRLRAALHAAWNRPRETASHGRSPAFPEGGMRTSRVITGFAIPGVAS